jgi:hypothetical protein
MPLLTFAPTGCFLEFVSVKLICPIEPLLGVALDTVLLARAGRNVRDSASESHHSWVCAHRVRSADPSHGVLPDLWNVMIQLKDQCAILEVGSHNPDWISDDRVGDGGCPHDLLVELVETPSSDKLIALRCRDSEPLAQRNALRGASRIPLGSNLLRGAKEGSSPTGFEPVFWP